MATQNLPPIAGPLSPRSRSALERLVGERSLYRVARALGFSRQSVALGLAGRPLRSSVRAGLERAVMADERVETPAPGVHCTRTDVDVMHCEARELAETIADRTARLESELALVPLALRLASLLIRLSELDGTRSAAG